MTLPLRPYQQAGLAKFLARRDKRLILNWCPGAGKTLGALAMAKSLEASRILVVSPARARPVWRSEFAQWWPEAQPHSILAGRENKSLSKKAAAARDAAYAADIQLTSYNLVKDLTAAPKGLLVIDELHKLADPHSQQSRFLRAFLKVHSAMPVVSLTGTLVRNEVQGIWNPLHTMWPGQWGAPTSAGDVAWGFRKKYCLQDENEYGTRFYGANPATMPELEKKLEPYHHRVIETDILEFLPKLSAKPLYVDDGAKLEAVVTSWAEQAVDDFTHVGFLAYHHKTAEAIAAKLKKAYPKIPQFYVSGRNHPEQRQNILDTARQSPRCIFVGTMEAVGESVSLTFLRTCLIAEWRTTPGQATQLVGRFIRAEKDALPVYLQYVVFPDDEARAAKLFERTTVVTSLLKRDAKAAVIEELMRPRALTEERLEQMHAAMFSVTHLALASAMIDEDDSDE